MENFDYRNGTALARLFFNRSFIVDDEEFYIDQFGQRQIKWWSSYFDSSSGLFEVKCFFRNAEMPTMRFSTTVFLSSATLCKSRTKKN
jgi:hypothetical protein